MLEFKIASFLPRLYFYFMRATLKLPLMIAVLAGVLPGASQAQNEMPVAAVPVAGVESESVPAGQEFTVLELFSSQACVFCPRADELFGALVTVPNVIGFACHVDYFDVRTGSLSRPFCTARQTWYMQALGAGPNYTPQLVVNGALDVIGYKLDEVTQAIRKAQQNPPLRMTVAKGTGAEDDEYRLSWKAQAVPADNEPAILWVMLIDRPHGIEIADGRNKGKQMNYMNIVSDMEDRGDWDRNALEKTIQVDLQPRHQGFIVIAQGRQTSRILAAAAYKIP